MAKRRRASSSSSDGAFPFRWRLFAGIFALGLVLAVYDPFVSSGKTPPLKRLVGRKIMEEFAAGPEYEMDYATGNCSTICQRNPCRKGDNACISGRKLSPYLTRNSRWESQYLVAYNYNTGSKVPGFDSVCALGVQSDNPKSAGEQRRRDPESPLFGSYTVYPKDSPFSFRAEWDPVDQGIHQAFDLIATNLEEPRKGRKSVLVLGIGGGKAGHSLGIIAHDKTLDFVDADPAAIWAAKYWFCSPQRKKIHYFVSDGLDFLRKSRKAYLFTLVDVSVDGETPERFMSKEFLRELHRNTEEGGLAVLNVMQVHGERKDMLERDAKAYFKAVEFQPVGPWAQNGNSYVITLKK